MNESMGTAAGTALGDYAHHELDSAIARLGWRGGRLHAGVHEARKSLRRARAALALDAGVLGPGAALVDRELRRINDGLSSLRDAQALVETLDRQLAIGHDAMTIRLLRRVRRVAAGARVVAARDVLARDPGLAERRAMLQVLSAAMAALPWASVPPTQLRDRLADSQSRMDQAQTRAIASGRDEDWHRWRRRARRLSQQRRALKSSGLDAEVPLAHAAFDKPTTERLGVAQDLSLLLEHCGRRSVFDKPDRLALRRYAEPELAALRHRIAHAAGDC
ncbi:MAG: CHAD domain-containing protein [Lysobacter sp.]